MNLMWRKNHPLFRMHRADYLGGRYAVHCSFLPYGPECISRKGAVIAFFLYCVLGISAWAATLKSDPWWRHKITNLLSWSQSIK